MSDLIAGLGKNYEVEKEIGRGGMGVVYLANDNRLDRKVAIKVLTLSGENDGNVSTEEVVKRFQREAKAIAKLSHTNIVNIYDIGDENNSYFMVMEFLDGKPLSNIVASKKRIPPALVVSIGLQVCNALEYAHEHGVVHRDIKPENIILSRKGTVKLTDFGIAQLSKDQIKLTQAGSVLGSIMYIPPEQLQDASKVDHRADIYSLGITLFELITGILPFESENISEIFMKILTENPPSLKSFYDDIPEALDAIVAKALVKDMENRYQTAGEMARDLAKLLDSDAFPKDDSISASSFYESRGTAETLTSMSPNTSGSRSAFTQTTLRRTSIDKTYIQVLKKNSLWLAILLEDWKTEQINNIPLSQVINKVMEPSLYGKAFTGAIVLNKSIYLFVFDGNFIGAVDLNNGFTGATVFQSLPEKPDLIELKIADETNLSVPVIISNILEGQGIPVHEKLDSSLVNLLQLMENLKEESFSGYISCYSENNIYYLGYENGNNIFFVPVIKVSESTDPNQKLDMEYLITIGVIFNAYTAVPVLAGPTVFNLLKNSTVMLGYNNPNKANLYEIVDMANQEIPIHIIKETKQNTVLTLDLQRSPELNIFNNSIDLIKVVKKSLYYQFSEWLVQEYFYLLNSSGNITSLKYIYSWIPAIENFRFFDSLTGEDGNQYDFSIVFNGQVKGENYKKVLMLTRFGNGTKEDVDKFIEETILVKKKLIKSGDIGGAIYISTEEYESDSLKLFYERTVEPRKGFGLGSLDKLTKYKGFVRIGFGRGFHLNLLEYRARDNSFEVIAPLLK